MLWALFGSGLEHTVVERWDIAGVRQVWCAGDDVLVRTDDGLVTRTGQVTPVLHTGTTKDGGAAWVRWNGDVREVGAMAPSGEVLWTGTLDRVAMTHTGVAIDVERELLVVQTHTRHPSIHLGEVEIPIGEFGDTWPILSPDGEQVLLVGYMYLGVASTSNGTATILDDEQMPRVAAWDARGAVVASQGTSLRSFPDGWSTELGEIHDLARVGRTWLVLVDEQLVAVDAKTGARREWAPPNRMSSPRPALDLEGHAIASCGDDRVAIAHEAGVTVLEVQ